MNHDIGCISTFLSWMRSLMITLQYCWSGPTTGAPLTAKVKCSICMKHLESSEDRGEGIVCKNKHVYKFVHSCALSNKTHKGSV